ncbi:UNKNOWN [Stylonychia lemnae]|uniref:Uncharacterized protein n=1 Tax=Stylonychia lemnae TaxID=5949 RepID=A0A078AZY9_STYLE|nr:UNKNOWN [Stylonychia lemnae]|eukprot:CDW87651.1 UNKNOWN [Stylonychia lemnae]
MLVCKAIETIQHTNQFQIQMEMAGSSNQLSIVQGMKPGQIVLPSEFMTN